MKEWLKTYSPWDVGKFYDEKYKEAGFRAFASEDRGEILCILSRYGDGKLFGKSVLDVGCGSGEFLSLLLDEGMKCFGIDVSKEACVLAKQRLGGSAFIYNTPVEYFEFPSQFDFVTCLGTIEHTMLPVKSLDRMLQFTKLGGFVLITVPLEFEGCLDWVAKEKNSKTNERFATVDKWRSLFSFRDNAFQIIGDGERKDVALVYKKG